MSVVLDGMTVGYFRPSPTLSINNTIGMISLIFLPHTSQQETSMLSVIAFVSENIQNSPLKYIILLLKRTKT